MLIIKSSGIELENYMTRLPCKACNGKRLKPDMLAVTVGAVSISELCSYAIKKAFEFFINLPNILSEKENTIALRKRGSKTIEQLSIDNFIKNINEEIKERK